MGLVVDTLPEIGCLDEFEAVGIVAHQSVGGGVPHGAVEKVSGMPV